MMIKLCLENYADVGGFRGIVSPPPTGSMRLWVRSTTVMTQVSRKKEHEEILLPTEGSQWRSEPFSLVLQG